MSFNVASAILRGRWLLDKQWAGAHLPLVFRLMDGHDVDFGISAAGRRLSFNDPDGNDEESAPPRAEKVAAARNVYSVTRYTDLSTLPNGSIAMLTLEGPLMKRGGLCSYGMVDHAELINSLSVASNISGILLNIDSPGGQASGTAMLAQTIKEAGSKKPVVAIIDDGMAASAAMWIASAANEIYVTQLTDQVGSVGVYTTIADWNTHYREYFKLPVREIYAPQSTDKNGDYIEALDGNDDPIKEDLAVLADQFINTVSANRSGKIKGDAWKTGKMFYAKDAKRIGLIDGIKSFVQVVNRLESLISSSTQSNKNTMAFENTLKAAKAESFDVTDDGFALQEAHLNAIEETLTAHSAELATANKTISARDAALATAYDTISARDAELATAHETISSLDAELTAAAEVNTTLQNRVNELEAQVKELGKESSGTGTVIGAPEDEAPGAQSNGKPSWFQEDGTTALARKYGERK